MSNSHTTSKPEAINMTFSDVVQLIRQFYAYDDLGYAEAAKILDKAIEPQIDEQVRLARLDELKNLAFSDEYEFHYEIGKGSIESRLAELSQPNKLKEEHGNE